MGRKSDDSSIRSDRLSLDFGKNKFRIEEKQEEPAKAGQKNKQERKLAPEPGRVPPASSVPWSGVLNRWKKSEN